MPRPSVYVANPVGHPRIKQLDSSGPESLKHSTRRKWNERSMVRGTAMEIAQSFLGYCYQRVAVALPPGAAAAKCPVGLRSAGHLRFLRHLRADDRHDDSASAAQSRLTA